MSGAARNKPQKYEVEKSVTRTSWRKRTESEAENK